MCELQFLLLQMRTHQTARCLSMRHAYASCNKTGVISSAAGLLAVMLTTCLSHAHTRPERHPSLEASSVSSCQYACKASAAACQPGSWRSRQLARVGGTDAVMANLSGKLHVVRPHNGSNERFQSGLVTAEEGLVVALILIVLL